jgi:DNA-binding transcriptional LysR family regulator
LRTFIAAVDEGSFSAAARRLRRAQSAVSQTLATLEGQLGVTLFDRSGRLPVLTEQGRALIAEARAAAGGMDLFKARAKSLAGGLEAELSVVVDVMFPISVLTEAVGAFQARFPATPLRLYVEALGAVLKPVLDGRCAFGVMGSLPTAPPQVTLERLLGVPMTMVAAPQHPLAAHPGPIPSDMLAQCVQLVLTDRSDLSAGREFGVMSTTTWRIADLGAKHAFLRAGLGWGSMPLNVVEADIAAGVLFALSFEDGPPSGGFVMPLSAVYPTASPPGPAGRWLIDQLKLEAVGKDNDGAYPPTWAILSSELRSMALL